MQALTTTGLQRQIGCKANRRLLDVQTISHDGSIGEEAFEKVVRPIEVEGQRASALRFGDRRIQALFSVLVLFSLQARGFTHCDMRALLAQLLGLDPAQYPQGRMTYDLRRLRLHGLIERLPHSYRYEPTALGLRVALFFSRTYARLLRPALSRCKNTTLKINTLRLPLLICRTAKYAAGLSLIAENQVVTLSRHPFTLKGLLLRPILAGIAPNAPPGHSPIRAAFERLQILIDQACQEAQLAAG